MATRSTTRKTTTADTEDVEEVVADKKSTVKEDKPIVPKEVDLRKRIPVKKV